MMVALPVLPNAPAVGDPATSSWADLVAAWLAFLAAPPLCRLANSVGQSIPSNAWTVLGFDTELVDSVNGHSNTVNNSAYYPQYPGTYRIKGLVTYAANATGLRGVALTINGAAVGIPDQAVGGPTATGSPAFQVDRIIALTVGQFVQLSALQVSGAALATIGLACFLEAEWLSS